MDTEITKSGRKNIGVFFNCSEVRFQRKFCHALSSAAKKMDYNLLFFMTFEVIDDESDFNKMNEKMMKFAPIEHLDAIIVAYDTFDRQSIRQVLEDEIRARATCPVISFREKYKDFLCISSNANDAIINIINHLADYHHCKNIAFMAGYEDHYDSNERLKRYLETMKAKGLPVYDNFVFHGDMWRFKGEEAFRYFFQDPDHIPEAIVCANDHMARALSNAAIEHGVRVPEDLKITGVDDIAEAVEYHPTLTTVSVDLEGMAERTMEVTDKLINHQYIKNVIAVPAKIMYRESCGCYGEEVMVSYQQQLNQYYERMSHLLGQPHNQTMFQIDLDGCNTMEELLDTIQRNVDLVVKHKSLYICLSGEENENGGRTFSEDVMDVVHPIFAYNKGQRLEIQNKSFRTDNLLMVDVYEKNKPKTIYFSLLHDSHNCIGFMASEFDSMKDTVDQYYFDWVLKISLALNKHFISAELKHLLEQTKQKSLTDFMTGMSNRRGLEMWVSKNTKEWIASKEEIAFMTLDLDGLKKINDNLGHEAGDMAIVTASKIIKKKCPKSGICARTGGDEFLMVFPASKASPEEVAAKIESSMQRKNAAGAFPFKLSISQGWYITRMQRTTRVEDCLAESDKKMYEMKDLHHQDETM
ncbi:substrate-binding and GGDEF domain-containing protein [Butyrivibrio sp. WCD2001]|uniref:substrate-binding and GGDEF domain-containing protein n=1 Tax=Butyrivibrio sp. WCD2001 TaxID=1280681 RepID=UPI00040C1879|nr:GGDEF domain-containing protein [Butyrivibrio sp. WCD2001]